jgi:hypothetical protein
LAILPWLYAACDFCWVSAAIRQVRGRCSRHHELTEYQLVLQRLQRRLVLRFLHRVFLLGIGDDLLEVLYPLVPTQQSFLSLVDLLLERRILFNELLTRLAIFPFACKRTHLFLDCVQRLEVVLHKLDASSLGFRVCRSHNQLVLFPDLIQLHFELDDLRGQL